MVMEADGSAGMAQVEAVHGAAEQAEARCGVIDRAQRPGHVGELPVAISAEAALNQSEA